MVSRSVKIQSRKMTKRGEMAASEREEAAHAAQSGRPPVADVVDPVSL